MHASWSSSSRPPLLSPQEEPSHNGLSLMTLARSKAAPNFSKLCRNWFEFQRVSPTGTCRSEENMPRRGNCPRSTAGCALRASCGCLSSTSPFFDSCCNYLTPCQNSARNRSNWDSHFELLVKVYSTFIQCHLKLKSREEHRICRSKP